MSQNVYIFKGNNAKFSSAVFSSTVLAEDWIIKNTLSGVLTEYILDVPVYDWAVEKGYFKPKSDVDKSARFIGGFSTAYQKHWHFVDGVKEE